MRAVEIVELTGPDTALRLTDRAEPGCSHPLAPGEGVVIEVKAAGVSFVSAVIPSFTDTELIAGSSNVRSAAPIQPIDVARAILSVIENGQDEMYVPRKVRPIGIALGLLPRRAQHAIHHRLGTDRAFIDLDAERRAGYDARVGNG